MFTQEGFQLIRESLEQYRQQKAVLEGQLQQLDQQRELAVNTIHQVVGAIAALETLIQESQKEQARPAGEQ